MRLIRMHNGTKAKLIRATPKNIKKLRVSLPDWVSPRRHGILQVSYPKDDVFAVFCWHTAWMDGASPMLLLLLDPAIPKGTAAGQLEHDFAILIKNASLIVYRKNVYSETDINTEPLKNSLNEGIPPATGILLFQR